MNNGSCTEQPKQVTPEKSSIGDNPGGSKNVKVDSTAQLSSKKEEAGATTVRLHTFGHSCKSKIKEDTMCANVEYPNSQTVDKIYSSEKR